MAQRATSKQSRHRWSGAVEEFFDWVETTMFCMILAIVVLTYLFQEVQVDGTSMVPTLQDGDRLVTSSLFYHVEPGDIVVINRDEGQEPLIKRCIAVAGQTVDIDFDAGVVYVDGVALQEDYVNTPTNAHSGSLIDFPCTVPEGHIFVMGDNRNNSLDSRYAEIGMIDLNDVFGEVIFRLLPLDRFGAVD